MEHDGISQLEQQSEALEDSLGDAAVMAAGVDNELRRVRGSAGASALFESQPRSCARYLIWELAS